MAARPARTVARAGAPEQSHIERVRGAIGDLIGVAGRLPEGLGRFMVTSSRDAELGALPVGAAPLMGTNALSSLGVDVDFRRMLAQRRAEQLRAIKAIGDFDVGAIVRHTSDSRWKIICRDASSQGKWRTQSFDLKGFSGHLTFETRAQAIEDAATSGFTVRDDAALDRVQNTPAFQRGLFASDLILKVNTGALSFLAANEALAEYDRQAQVLASIGAASAQAYYEPASNTMIFLADRIPPGHERGVFLHEVVHKHGRRALGAEGWARLTGQVLKWASAPRGSLERTIHDAAFARAAAAVGGRAAPPELFREELLAYAVEEAVRQGVRPRARAVVGTAEHWLADVVATLRALTQRLVGAPEGVWDLDVQEVVDLAYALAQLEHPDRAREIRQALGPELERVSAELARALQPPAGEAMWRSALLQAVSGASMTRAPARQWRESIQALTAKGVSEAEIHWSGVLDWLQLQGEAKLTRGELVGYLMEEGVRIKETVLEGDGKLSAEVDRAVVELSELGYEIESDSDGAVAALLHVKTEERFAWNERNACFMLDEMPRATRGRAHRRSVGDDDADSAHAGERANELGILVRTERSKIIYGENDPSGARYANYVQGGRIHGYREILLSVDGLAPAINAKLRGAGANELDRDQLQVLAQGGKVALAMLRELDQVWGIDTLAQQRAIKGGRGAGNFMSPHWEQPNVVVHVRVTDRLDQQGRRTLMVEEIQSDQAQQARRQGFVQRYRREELSINPDSDEQRWVVDAPGQRFIILRSKAPTQDDVLDYIAQEKRAGGTVEPAPFIGNTEAWVSLAVKRIIRMAADGGYDCVAFVSGDQVARQFKQCAWVDELELVDRELAGPRCGLLLIGRMGGKAGFHRDMASLAELEREIGRGLTTRLLGVPARWDMRRVLPIERTQLLSSAGRGLASFYDVLVPRIVRRVAARLGADCSSGVQIAGENGEFSRQNGFAVTPALRQAVRQGLTLFSLAEQDAEVVRAVAALADEGGGDPDVAQARAQCAQVAARHLGRESWLRAPNGLPTKLTASQWVMVRTENFKRWFGDWENDPGKASSVLDPETLEPRVVYHGSPNAGFAEFDLDIGQASVQGAAFFSSDPCLAATYSGSLDEAEINGVDEFGDYERDSGIYPVFLNIRDPSFEDYEGAAWSGERHDQWHLVDEDGDSLDVEGRRVFTRDEAERLHTLHPHFILDEAPAYWGSTNDAAAAAKRNRCDGAILCAVTDEGRHGGGYGDPSDVYVVFSGRQVKSATRNVGTYNDGWDIRYSLQRPLQMPAQTPSAFEAWFGESKMVATVDPQVLRLGVEYEARLFGGAYSASRLRTAARDAPIREMIALGRLKYNAIRNKLGMDLVRDWTRPPHSLVQRFKGQPLVVFHGSAAKEDFGVFDEARQGQTAGVGGGFFFTDKRETALDVYGWRGGDRVLEVYLRIERPLTLPAYFALTGKDPVQEMHGGRDSPTNYFDNESEQILEFARSNGYDGLMFEDTSGDQGAANLYVVFRADQIKSATDNSGQFDRNNPDIRYSLRVDEAAHKDEAASVSAGPLAQLRALIEQADGDVGEVAFESRVECLVQAIQTYAARHDVYAVLQPWGPSGPVTGVELTDLYASEPGRGQGSRVMTRLTALAQALQVPVYLRPDGPRSREFYARAGFVPVSARSAGGPHGFLAWYPAVADDDNDNDTMAPKERMTG